MKKLVVVTAVMTVMACGSFAQAQSASEHKIALIDMAHVFKNYKKFESMREGLKGDITSAEDSIKQDLETIKTLQAQLGQLDPNSPQYAAKEKELAAKAADIEASRKVQQRDFLRKESKIYKEVYMEVTHAVSLYADHYKYSLVLRFNRADMDSNAAPDAVIKGMNRQVVYYRPENDITDAVLDYLNKKYGQTAGAPATGATK